jgi:hypothetical protein
MNGPVSGSVALFHSFTTSPLKKGPHSKPPIKNSPRCRILSPFVDGKSLFLPVGCPSF